MKKFSVQYNIRPRVFHVRSLFTTHTVQYLFAARNAPHRAIIVSNRSGNYQLYAVDFHTGFYRQITDAKHGVLFGSISSGGRYIYFLSDTSGTEHGHFMRIPFEGGDSIDVTPNLKPYFSYSVSSSDNEETLCFTAALNNKNKVFVVRKDKNNKHQTFELYNTGNLLSEPICAPDGSMVCVTEINANAKESHLIFLPTIKGAKAIYSRRFNSVIPLAFTHTRERKMVLALMRRADWYRPVIYDISKGRITEIHHSSFRGDVWALSWDETCRQIILCDVYRAEQKLYLYNTHTKRLKRIGPKTGSFNFHFGSSASRNKNSFIVRWSDFNTSPRLITIHGPRYNIWRKIPEWSGDVSSHYVTESVWTKSSDGKRVQMWMARPRGTTKPIPFVINIHGGPHGVVLNEFSPEAHAWLKNGFGYCAVNYRGSVGFGKRFERKIYGNPGHWEVEDIVAARNWLVRNKHADSKHIALYGWSWGGYVTLLALGKYPEFWSSGIAGAAIADCIIQYEDEPAHFKAQDQEIFRGTPETAHMRYVRNSPITYVNHIQSPLLILHGKNDVRCPPRQTRHFINALKENNKRFTVEWFESGHTGAFTDTNLRTELVDKAISFAINAQKNNLSR